MIISANNFLLIKVLVGPMFAKHVLIALKWGVCVCFFFFYKAFQVIKYLFQLVKKILVKTYLHLHTYFTVILNSLPNLKFYLQIF